METVGEGKLPGWITEHVELYKTDPEKAHMWDSSVSGAEGLVQTLLLTTIGRKSGEVRSHPLIYQKSGNAYVVVASKAGAKSHPAWYLNLLSNSECKVQVASKSFTAIAKTLTSEEGQEIWPELVRIFPPYELYQASARGSREIPIVALEVV